MFLMTLRVLFVVCLFVCLVRDEGSREKMIFFVFCFLFNERKRFTGKTLCAGWRVNYL